MKMLCQQFAFMVSHMSVLLHYSACKSVHRRTGTCAPLLCLYTTVVLGIV